MPGELPESYIVDLHQLAKAICYDGDIGTTEQFVLCQFVDGLPEPTQSQLQVLKSGGRWNTEAVLDCAKNMLMQRPDIKTASSFLGWQTVRREDMRGAEGTVERWLVQWVGQPGGVVERGTRRMGKTGGPHQGQSLGLRCHGCGKQGHIHHDCHIWCFLCGSPWHLRCECMMQGNG